MSEQNGAAATPPKDETNLADSVAGLSPEVKLRGGPGDEKPYCWLARAALDRIKKHHGNSSVAVNARSILLALAEFSSHEENKSTLTMYLGELAARACLSTKTVYRTLPFIEELKDIEVDHPPQGSRGKHTFRLLSLRKAKPHKTNSPVNDQNHQTNSPVTPDSQSGLEVPLLKETVNQPPRPRQGEAGEVDLPGEETECSPSIPSDYADASEERTRHSKREKGKGKGKAKTKTQSPPPTPAPSPPPFEVWWPRALEKVKSKRSWLKRDAIASATLENGRLHIQLKKEPFEESFGKHSIETREDIMVTWGEEFAKAAKQFSGITYKAEDLLLNLEP